MCNLTYAIRNNHFPNDLLDDIPDRLRWGGGGGHCSLLLPSINQFSVTEIKDCLELYLDILCLLLGF